MMKKYYNKLCKCGCGNRIKVNKFHVRIGIPNYIHGHYNRGKKFPETSKRMMGDNNPSKRPDVRLKLRKNHPSKKKNYVNPMYGKERVDMQGDKNPSYKPSIEIQCKTCKKRMIVKPFQAKKKFCSSLCCGKFYSGNNNVSKRPEVRKKLRIKRLNEILKFGGQLQLGNNEERILDEWEKCIKYKINRQYIIAGYRVDGYIPELNIVFEIDEPHHFDNKGNLVKKDIIRQKEIEKELNCDFIRIWDI